jgi:hypothetical protein
VRHLHPDRIVGQISTQHDLFDPPIPPTEITLPPCGRGLGPCKAIIEYNQIHCLVCRCVGPRKSQPTFLDGYLKSPMKFLRSR